jgi:hypothetical protein
VGAAEQRQGSQEGYCYYRNSKFHTNATTAESSRGGGIKRPPKNAVGSLTIFGIHSIAVGLIGGRKIRDVIFSLSLVWRD